MVPFILIRRSPHHFRAKVETELSSWENHTMITKWGQQNELNEETSENNMLNDLFGASEYIFYTFRLPSNQVHVIEECGDILFHK